VEAYIRSEERWQALDPSPSDLRDQVVAENRSPWQRLSEIADAASTAWATYFVGYSNMDQRDAFMALARDLWRLTLDALHNLFVGLPTNFFRWDFWASLRGVWALATAAILALALRKTWRLTRGLHKRVAVFRRRASTWPLFRDWNRFVERLGFQRRLSETPREFARRVADELHADARLAPFTRLHGAVVDAFYASRYGGIDADGALHPLREDLRAFGRAAT
jgi:hypothetical protein